MHLKFKMHICQQWLLLHIFRTIWIDRTFTKNYKVEKWRNFWGDLGTIYPSRPF